MASVIWKLRPLEHTSGLVELNLNGKSEFIAGRNQDADIVLFHDKFPALASRQHARIHQVSEMHVKLKSIDMAMNVSHLVNCCRFPLAIGT